MPHDHLHKGVPLAAKISGWACEHGTVTLELYGQDGASIAIAAMSLKNFEGIVATIKGDCNGHNLKTAIVIAH